MNDKLLRRIILSIALAVIAAVPVRAAKATSERFDGPWSVVIITDEGNCDRAYRYGLRIEAGRVYYAGGSDVLGGRGGRRERARFGRGALRRLDGPRQRPLVGRDRRRPLAGDVAERALRRALAGRAQRMRSARGRAARN